MQEPDTYNIMPRSSAKPFRFLDLPTEIQSMILDTLYEGQLYIHGQPVVEEYCRRCYRFDCMRVRQGASSKRTLRQYVCNLQITPLLVSRLFYSLATDVIRRKQDVLFRFPEDSIQFAYFSDLTNTPLQNLASIVTTVQIHELRHWSLQTLKTCFPRLKTLELGSSYEIRSSLTPIVSKLAGTGMHAMLSGRHETEVIDEAREAIKMLLTIGENSLLDGIEIHFSFQMRTLCFSEEMDIHINTDLVVFDCMIDQHGGKVLRKWFQTYDTEAHKYQRAGMPAYISLLPDTELPVYEGVEPIIQEYDLSDMISTIFPGARFADDDNSFLPVKIGV